jgi:ferredoxin
MTVDAEAEKAVCDLAKCMGCGVCADSCPEEAITLTRDASELEPVDMRALRAKYGS